MSPSLILHVGLPKTGTTFLQKEILPNVPDVRYVDGLGTEILQPESGPACGVVGQFFTCTTRVWDDMGDRLFADFIGPASEPGESCSTVVISDEGIGKAGKHPEHMELHLRCLAKKASGWGYGAVKIICSIRRQDQWIGSHYAQVSDRAPSVSQEAFERYVYDRISSDRNLYRFGSLLDYRCIRDAFCRVMGADNVAMIPFEMLKEDAEAYLTTFLSFINPDSLSAVAELCERWTRDKQPVGTNKRSSGADRWRVRRPAKPGMKSIRLRPSRLFGRLGLPPFIMIPETKTDRPDEVVMTPELKRDVMSVYAPGNKGLANDLRLDLSRYGYY